MSNTSSNTMITSKEVENVAKLSELNISGDEEKISSMLSDTLSYIDILNELDTSNTLETYQVTGLANVFKDESILGDRLSKDQSLSNASEVIDGYIATKAVFEDR